MKELEENMWHAFKEVITDLRQCFTFNPNFPPLTIDETGT